LSQCIVPYEVIYRTAHLFLKNKNVGDFEDSANILKKAVNKIYAIDQTFNQVFLLSGFETKYPETRNGIYEMIDKFVGNHNDETKFYSRVYGFELEFARNFKVGDYIEVQEWGYDPKEMGIMEVGHRFFLIDETDFSEFNIRTGELL